MTIYVRMVADGLDVVWERDLHMQPGAWVGRPSDGVLIGLERGRRLVRLGPATGEALWEANVENAWGELALGQRECVYLSQGGILTCLELDDGEVRWSASGVGQGYVEIVGDVVVTGGWRGYSPVRAFDLATGASRWENAGPPGYSLGWPDMLWPQRLGSALVSVRQDEPAIRILDPATGQVMTTWDLSAPFANSAGGRERAFRQADGDTLTFGDREGVVMVLSAADGPRTVWRHPSLLAAGVPLLQRDRLWVLDRTGLTIVMAPDATTIGTYAMEHGFHEGLVGLPDGAALATRGGKVCILNDEGALVQTRQVGRRIGALVSVHPGLLHVIGKGSLITLAT